jgi:hypothetical protein
MMKAIGWRSVSLLACLSLWLGGCGGTVDEEPLDVTAADIEPGGAHQMPLSVSDGTVAAESVRPAISAHLTYFGGRVVSKMQITQVLYGAGTYLSNLTSSSAPSMSSFYGQVSKSNYVTWLTEYNTPSQTIGTGTFNAKIQITPSATRNRSTISDGNIQAELSAQIGSGTLPAPGPNVIYMVNFPKGKRITQGGTSSCVGGGFCAYHGTFKRNGVEVFYGVLPDMSPGSGCDSGCGGSSQFNNQTSVASHELIETVTDAEVGLATVLGKPLAWYDPNNGEIGDICNGIQGTIAGSDGHTYTVQKEWSNQQNACIVHK